MTDYRDRIKSLRRVPVKDLRANPRNWRTHPDGQRTAMAGLLEQVGFADAILARETDDGLEIIDGHLRAELSDSQKIPVLVLNVDAEEADVILATHDPIAAMATIDRVKIDELMAKVTIESESALEMLRDLTSVDVHETDAPDEFAEMSTDTTNTCPKCKYQWGSQNTKSQRWTRCER